MINSDSDMELSKPYWLIGQPPPGMPAEMYSRPPNTIATINLISIANIIAQGRYSGLSDFSFQTLQESLDVKAIILSGSIVENLHGLPDKVPSSVPEDIDFSLIYTLGLGETKQEKEEKLYQAMKELGEFYYGIELHCRLFEYEELKENIAKYAFSASAREQLFTQIKNESSLKEGVEKNPVIYALPWFMDPEDISPLPYFGHFEVLSGHDIIEELKL